MKSNLINRIKQRKSKIGVIGLGYVGLPLALEFGEKGFPVSGFDIDQQKINALLAGRSYIHHLSADRIRKVFGTNKKNKATTDFKLVKECDAIIICVPTPLTKNRDPDMSFIVSTAEKIGSFIRKGCLISLESTTYPGTTNEVLIPIIERKSGMKAGRDFGVAYSPEREDPSNPSFTTASIPKVVGAINKDSLEVATALYGSIICKTVPVSDCRTAEAVKLVENIFRSVNIALVNELKMVFTEMKIDIWEVIKAASTKPFGYMPFYPGPGLGGHCIPIDPFYLSWKAREYGLNTKFIELAGEINTKMPEYVIQRTIAAFNERGKPIKNAKILLVGLAYKKNVDDTRESPTFILWELLEKLGTRVEYFDPLCPVVPHSRAHKQLAGRKSIKWEDIKRKSFDAAIIATAHDCVNHEQLVSILPMVIDTRGTCKNSPKVIRA